MGQLVLIQLFLIVSIPTDVNDDRRHVHIFKRGTRFKKSIAKICIETSGIQDVQIAYSELSTKENTMLLDIINKYYIYQHTDRQMF